ncbi:uncharacterized protein [Pseudorasbora parva]|uniref:uncharacterized protein n=1 Tax=Pseudorasbora parva TaxID=51549 RepID=UPI00351F5D84
MVCSSDVSYNVDIAQEDVKVVQAGEDVNLTCSFSNLLQSTTAAWFKQTDDGKSLQIVSFNHHQQPSWNKDFEKMNRFNVIKAEDYFNLTILQTKPSDSATYYCVVSSHYSIGMGPGTRLIFKAGHTTVHQSLIDALHPGDSVDLQCSIFSESCAGEHSVYCFRQSLGDSQGVLYTKGERNGQCKNSSESQTQSCVYNLLKSNISHSDAGIYYCAVAACGQILLGKGTEINIRESDANTILLVLGISNIIFLTLAVFLIIKLCQKLNKGCSSDVSPNNVDVAQEDVKVVRAGEDVNLTCTSSEFLDSTSSAWFKQTDDGKSLQIVFSYRSQQPSRNKDFGKMNRFNVSKGDNHFNLTILKSKPSDSATYYCVVSSYAKIGMGLGTRLIVRDAAVAHTTLHQSLTDALHPGDSVDLQCSIFSESCAGEHSVYWFRQSLGDSQGVLYTKGERNGQCKNSSESQTQSCVYNLLKSNISHSDAGIYYCAVAACGLLFGKGTEINIRG